MSKVKQNIFLIGPMGSGKTTIGKQLAKMLGLEFYDCDHELERLTGASVNLIFDVEGEAGFRLRERQMLNRLSKKSGVLIATGGGVVCEEENRRVLRSRGFVVYLKTGVEEQLKRLSKDKTRPLLQAEDRAQRLKSLARGIQTTLVLQQCIPLKSLPPGNSPSFRISKNQRRCRCEEAARVLSR